ncbi:hypothetical protein DITRI_Ditri03aG0179100 [Diplodiscus trichospermus]
MALLASPVSPSTLNIKVKQFEHQPSSQLHGFLLQLNGHRRVTPKCGMRITMARFGEPNKIKEQLNIIKEKLWEHTPDSVKDIPWKKAENLLLQRLLSVGQKALKLSIVTLFVFSFLSDFIYSISRNQELMIPFGLIVGCFLADFLKETYEAFCSTEVSSVPKYSISFCGYGEVCWKKMEVKAICFPRKMGPSAADAEGKVL